jgi:ABC-2 type transport system ATP-binding protein
MTDAARFVEVRHRWNRRSPEEALKGVSFSVPTGAMLGLVGPDGAGKTTLLRALCHLFEPEKGEVFLFGEPVAKDPSRVRTLVGYLAQKFSLYGDLTVDENIAFFGEIYGVENAAERGRALLGRMGMDRFGSRLASKLSGGMKQKLALTVALLHRPRLLVLDEPTNGVDPVSRREFWVVLGELVAEGLTILVSTPYLDEAAKCQRVAMLNEGRLLCQGTVEEVVARTGAQLLELIAENPRAAREALAVLPDAARMQTRGERLEFLSADPQELRREIEAILSRAQIPVLEWSTRTPDLENAFLELLRQEVRP